MKILSNLLIFTVLQQVIKSLTREDYYTYAEMAYIDCKEHQKICEEQLNTYSYPATKYIVRGNVVDIPMKGRT